MTQPADDTLRRGDGDGGRLIRLPVRNTADAPALPLPAQGSEIEQIVYEAELLDEPQPGTEAPRRLPALVAARPAVEPYERTVKAARALVAVTVTTGQGWHSWWVRAWDALTMGVYRRQIRAAEAAGDREALAEWLERKRQASTHRHDRLMVLPKLALNVVKFAGIGCSGVLVLLLLLSFAVWATGVGAFGDVFVYLGGAIRVVLTVLKALWPVVTVAVPVALVVAAYREGRRVAEPPAFLAGDEEAAADGREVIPDEGAILNALRNLGISDLNKAFRGGWRPRFVLPTERDGKGYHTQVELPPAVTVEMINDRKKVLAHNLVRFPVEVWATEPKPGLLDLWVADQGSLSGPVPPWPLLADGGADYFRGVPVAVNIRGKVIVGRLSEANYAVAGMMGSGKSTLIITLLLGALLDPLVEAEVFVMATNADYDTMRPRLRTLLTGPGDEIVEACLATLRDVYADLTVRGKALQEWGERAVTRELAEKDARLRPRIVVVDECQALFMHPEMGEEAADLTVKLISAARKYGITLIFATPEPSTTSLPRKVMAVTSNKACFAIGDQRSNDAILGTGSYKAGISATSLEPKTEEGPGDVGTFMARGFTPKPGLLRGFYVSQAEAKTVVERAMKLREQAGIHAGRAAAAEQPRDLLEDLAEVLGDEPVPAADVPALLAHLAPRWAPYRSLTGKQLREQLAELGVKVPSTGNRWPVSREPVLTAIRRREVEGEGAG